MLGYIAMRVKITVITRQTVVADIGDIPPGLIEDVLRKNDGTFDGSWTIGDVRGSGSTEEFVTEKIEVEELA